MEIPDYKKKYWKYQYDLGKIYLIPLLEKWGVKIKSSKILDVGCAEGGVISAFSDYGALCTGFEISEDRIEIGKILCEPEKRKINFIAGDACDKNDFQKVGNGYDIVLLRDVIEHLQDKTSAIENIKQVLKPEGCVFVTFPPYYSPFGSHQQNLDSIIKFTPFVHLLPEKIYFSIIEKLETSEGKISEMKYLRKVKVTLKSFEKLANDSNLLIRQKKYYLFRPDFRLRYGIPEIKAQFLGYIPFLREFLIMGVFYLLGKKDVSK
jgi:SAM-dependent methyltransferase